MKGGKFSWIVYCCGFIMSWVGKVGLTMAQSCSENSERHTDNKLSQSICCQPVTILPGYQGKLCQHEGQDIIVEPCPNGTFQNETVESTKVLKRCKRRCTCDPQYGKITVSSGNATADCVCACDKNNGFCSHGTDCLQLHCDLISESPPSLANVVAPHSTNVTETWSQITIIAAIAIPAAVIIVCVIVVAGIIYRCKTSRSNNGIHKSSKSEIDMETNSGITDESEKLVGCGNVTSPPEKCGNTVNGISTVYNHCNIYKCNHVIPTQSADHNCVDNSDGESTCYEVVVDSSSSSSSSS